MRPTIAEVLIKNYDKNNPATISVIKEKAKRLKPQIQFKNLKQEEIEKIAIRRLKRNLVVKNRIAKIKSDPVKKELFLLKLSLYSKNRFENLKKNPLKLKKEREYKNKMQFKFSQTPEGKIKIREIQKNYRVRKKAKLFLFYYKLLQIIFFTNQN